MGCVGGLVGPFYVVHCVVLTYFDKQKTRPNQAEEESLFHESLLLIIYSEISTINRSDMHTRIFLNVRNNIERIGTYADGTSHSSSSIIIFASIFMFLNNI